MERWRASGRQRDVEQLQELERRREAEQRELVASLMTLGRSLNLPSGAAAPPATADLPAGAPLDAAPPQSEDDGNCAVCLTAKKTHAFYPCGHLACCGECAAKLKAGACVICRKPILDAMVVYK
jgi:hypothetical protein